MIVIYDGRFIPKHLTAVNWWFVTFIRPSSKGDKAVLEHEREHMYQINRYLILWPILYHCSRKWRLKFEAEAYAVSVKNGESLEACTFFLVELYDLDITPDVARDAIVEAMGHDV